MQNEGFVQVEKMEKLYPETILLSSDQALVVISVHVGNVDERSSLIYANGMDIQQFLNLTSCLHYG